VLLQKLQRDVLAKRKKKDKLNPEGLFLALRTQKCKVYSDEIVPQEPVKRINDAYKLFNIKSPVSIAQKL